MKSGFSGVSAGLLAGLLLPGLLLTAGVKGALATGDSKKTLAKEKEEGAGKRYRYPSEIITKNGFRVDEVASALQKEIRRQNREMAAYWARELHQSGESKRLWRRLKVISLEDVVDPVLVNMVFILGRQAEEDKYRGEVASLSAIIAAWELAKAPKSHVCAIDGYFDFKEKQGWKPEMPDYAIDMHTKRGRDLGRTSDLFWWMVSSKLVGENEDSREARARIIPEIMKGQQKEGKKITDEDIRTFIDYVRKNKPYDESGYLKKKVTGDLK